MFMKAISYMFYETGVPYLIIGIMMLGLFFKLMFEKEEEDE